MPDQTPDPDANCDMDFFVWCEKIGISILKLDPDGFAAIRDGYLKLDPAAAAYAAAEGEPPKMPVAAQASRRWSDNDLCALLGCDQNRLEIIAHWNGDQRPDGSWPIDSVYSDADGCISTADAMFLLEKQIKIEAIERIRGAKFT